MAMRCALLAAAVVGLVPVASPLASDLAATASRPASLSHSALKATTFKAGTVMTNIAVLSYATGGLAGGAALTAFITASAWTLYTANDYLWDTYSPPPEKQEFDARADAWRNTEKYLTYKPVIASIKLGSLYLYTGSAAVVAVFGTASILTNTVVFYANNMAWDWYDWYSAAPPAAPAR